MNKPVTLLPNDKLEALQIQLLSVVSGDDCDKPLVLCFQFAGGFSSGIPVILILLSLRESLSHFRLFFYGSCYGVTLRLARDHADKISCRLRCRTFGPGNLLRCMIRLAGSAGIQWVLETTWLYWVGSQMVR